jgi:hypothetical protein
VKTVVQQGQAGKVHEALRCVVPLALGTASLHATANVVCSGILQCLLAGLSACESCKTCALPAWKAALLPFANTNKHIILLRGGTTGSSGQSTA